MRSSEVHIRSLQVAHVASQHRRRALSLAEAFRMIQLHTRIIHSRQAHSIKTAISYRTNPIAVNFKAWLCSLTFFLENVKSEMYSANHCSRLCLCSRCSTQPANLRCFLSQPLASLSAATRCPNLRASKSHTLTAGLAALAMGDAPGTAAFTEDVQPGELASSITWSNPNGP